MEALCAREGFTCHCYDNKNPVIRKNKIEAGRFVEDSYGESLVAIVLKGHMDVSMGKFIDQPVAAGYIILLPRGMQFSIKFHSDTQILTVRLRDRMEFCDRLSLEWLYQNRMHDHEAFYKLPMNHRMAEFAFMLDEYISDGIRCKSFMNSKLQELLFIMRHYYTKEQLTLFFAPIMTSDSNFADFVHLNYHKYKTVQELAAASCHSLSSFNKLFRKAFGMSPYRWMQEQKANKIFHDIHMNDKPLKELCDEYGFSSLSQFSNFCKSQFGMSPRNIKRSTTQKNGVTGNKAEIIKL